MCGAKEAIGSLPIPSLNPAEKTNHLLSTLREQNPTDAYYIIKGYTQTNPDMRFEKLRYAIETKRDTEDVWETVQSNYSEDWRLDWYIGIAQLYEARIDDAAQNLNKTRQYLPGELAPVLALALAYELQDENNTAAAFYRQLLINDPSYTSAAFGLARTAADRDEKVQALNLVSPSSIHYLEARQWMLAFYVRSDKITLNDLRQANLILPSLDAIDSLRRQLITAELLDASLRYLQVNAKDPNAADPQEHVAGLPLTTEKIGYALGELLITIAADTDSTTLRHALLVRSNQVRPRRWL